MSKDQRVSVPDQREKPRKKVRYPFRLAHPGFGEKECETNDLSLSGALVEGRFGDIVPGDTVEMTFSTAAGEPAEYRFSASVVRVTPEGIALKFLGLDMDTYGALLDLTLKD